MTGDGNDEQRIALVPDLRIAFLAHGRALTPVGGGCRVTGRETDWLYRLITVAAKLITGLSRTESPGRDGREV